MTKNQIEIYQGSDGKTLVEVKFEEDTIWLTQAQMVALFDRERSVITKHINNIFKEQELKKEAVCAKFAHTADDGKIYQVEHYNLDVIISVGYRVKSTQGTQFRIWATQRLKEYLIQGYAINEERLTQKQQEVQTLKDGIRILSRTIEDQQTDSDLNWLAHFTIGLELLDDYDHEQLDESGMTKKPAAYPSTEEYNELIDTMRADFASTIFGKEKDGGFQSAVVQISKGFADKDFYPSIEEKAATLLCPQ